MKGEILCRLLVGLKGLEDKLSWGAGEGGVGGTDGISHR